MSKRKAPCTLQAQKEIDEVLSNAEQPDMAGYTNLKYLTRCVNESMRLYPHPPVLLRRAEVADTLPGVLVNDRSLVGQCKSERSDPHLKDRACAVNL